MHEMLALLDHQSKMIANRCNGTLRPYLMFISLLWILTELVDVISL
ncbi:hypothetical protein [Paenibacillus sp. FSL K6-2524]